MSARRSRVIEGVRLTQGLRRFARALGVNATMAETIAAMSEGREGRRDRIDSYASLFKASELQTTVRPVEKPAGSPARLAASGPPISRDGHRDSESARARAALAALPLDQRAALMLVVTEGLSHADAAEAMGVSPEAFLNLLAAARAAFAVEIAAPRDRPQLRLVEP